MVHCYNYVKGEIGLYVQSAEATLCTLYNPSYFSLCQVVMTSKVAVFVTFSTSYTFMYKWQIATVHVYHETFV